MGTFNRPRFMDNAKKILIKLDFDVLQVRWNTGKKNSIAYLNIDQWNIQAGSFVLGVGYSSGCFPLQKTNAVTTIGINPFLTVYPLLDYILHARNDKLVVRNEPIFARPKKELILYKGRHSTFPTKEFTKLIESLYT